MANPIESRDGFTMYAVDRLSDIDLSQLAVLSSVSWSLDYRGKTRMLYDAAYYSWLLGGNDWFGLMIRDGAGEPVACVFSLCRTLYCGGDAFKAVYSTGLTVAPHCRALGLGRWAVDVQRRTIFEERHNDLSLAMFQSGHGGLPVVSSSYRGDSQHKQTCFHSGAIWGKRLVSSPQPKAGVARAVKAAGLRLHFDATSASLSTSDNDVRAPSLQDLAHMARGSASLAFAPEASMARMYLGGDGQRSATLWFELGGGAQCAIAYSTVALAIDSVEIGKIAQLQTVLARHCTRAQLASALREACAIVRARGCVAASIVDQGYVPRGVLEDEGFAKSADELVFAFRGSPALLERVEQAAPPFMLDVL